MGGYYDDYISVISYIACGRLRRDCHSGGIANPEELPEGLPEELPEGLPIPDWFCSGVVKSSCLCLIPTQNDSNNF